MPMTNHQLVRQFTSGIDQPFLAYKENASINRALLKCKLKEKQLTNAEQKLLDTVSIEREEARMRKKRLAEMEKRKRLNTEVSDMISLGKDIGNS